MKEVGGQRSEIRDQMSDVKVKPISDLRLLISMVDDFNGFNDLNGLGNRDGILAHIFASVERVVCQLQQFFLV